MADTRPTAAQAAWTRLGYGLFLHFGPNTFTNTGWGDGTFLPANFDPRKLDTSQWAGMAAEAGMKYAVLTSKHHDGFCLWPSRHTEYSVKNSPAPDVVGRFVDAFRRAGIKTGFYYSLWDRNFKQYENDDAYAQYMQDQITELLIGYGDVVQIWFDGGWDKEYPTRSWEYDPAWEQDPHSGLNRGERWHWRELYGLIHRLQPNCIVLNNSSSDRPGDVRYHPVDARTSEHFDFVFRGRIHQAKTDPICTRDDGTRVHLPLEYCTSINPDWFWLEQRCYGHPSPAAIADWHRRARQTNANFLLNIGPDRDGLIPEYHRPILKAAASEMDLR